MSRVLVTHLFPVARWSVHQVDVNLLFFTPVTVSTPYSRLFPLVINKNLNRDFFFKNLVLETVHKKYHIKQMKDFFLFSDCFLCKSQHQI